MSESFLTLNPESSAAAFWPNKPDAVNPAMALRLTIEDQWRRVSDLERYPRPCATQRALGHSE